MDYIYIQEIYWTVWRDILLTYGYTHVYCNLNYAKYICVVIWDMTKLRKGGKAIYYCRYHGLRARGCTFQVGRLFIITVFISGGFLHVYC